MDDTKLTKDAIIAEALNLLKESGLDSVSLRRLAQRVGVRAPSLYWYFADKNALLESMMAHVFNQCLDSVPDACDSRDWMRGFGLALLKAQSDIPDFGRLVTMTDISSEHLDQTMAKISNTLAALDAPLQSAIQLQSAVQALATGWSAFTHAPYAAKLRQSLNLEAIAVASLDALITGWDWDAETDKC